MRPDLSVVIPAFNEQSRIARSIERIDRYATERLIELECLVVDDGSVDQTRRQAEAVLSAGRGRVLRIERHRGKGHAVRRGVLEARGTWVLITDADLSTPIEEHRPLQTAAESAQADIVIGSRGLASSRVDVPQSAPRRVLGVGFNTLVRLATGLPFRDTQCGFKLLHRDRCRPLFESMRIDGYAFDVELLVLCRLFGRSVVEAPVRWSDSGDSRVRPVASTFEMLGDILRIRRWSRQGTYPHDGRDMET